MKVLHVAETIVGGIASHLCELLPMQLAELGPENLHIIVPADQTQHLPSDTDLMVQPFDHPGSRIKAALKLRHIVAEAVERLKPDIVHIHSSFAGLAARTVSFKQPPQAIVYCPHGWSFAQLLPAWKRIAYARVERFLLRKTHSVICVSQHEKSLALSFGLLGDRLQVIRNGVADTVQDSVSTFESSDALMEMHDKLHFLFVGRFDRAKGVDYVFEAAADLMQQPHHFHIIGDAVGTDNRLPDTQWPNVSLYGWRSREFVAHMLARVDALLMPSRWEGLPMIGLEAFRAGCPIIGSDRSAMPELIGNDGSGIMINLDEPSALANCLKQLDGSQLKAMRVNARDRYLSQFTIERQHQQIMALYREACR